MHFGKIFFISFILISGGLFSEVSEPVIYEQKCDREFNATTLEKLAAQYDVFLLDAYGVFWGSSDVGVLPGAKVAMEYLISQGKYVAILSNSTQLSAREKAKLQKYGLFEGVHYHQLLTSGEVARELLMQESLPFPTPHHKYWLFGAPHPRYGSHLQIFEGTQFHETNDLQDADFIYISIPHINGVDQEAPEAFRAMVQAVGNQVPVLCVNPDKFAPEGSPPRPVVRQGTIAQMFAEQKAPVYLMGKPSKLIFELALKKVPQDVRKDRVVMIGDTPETDLRGAHSVGIDTVLVTKTGVTALILEKEGAAFIKLLPLDDQPEYLLDRFAR